MEGAGGKWRERSEEEGAGGKLKEEKREVGCRMDVEEGEARRKDQERSGECR